VTILTVEERCRWCGRGLAPRLGPGRPRRYCRQGCRQQVHLARKLAAAHGLGDDDVIVSRPALDELQGRLYCLQAALEDVERDLAAMDRIGSEDDAGELRQILAWLVENAGPAADLWIEPRTGST
jgi:hypothetical protein